MNNLKQSYELACNAYLKAFCDQLGLDYDRSFWIGSDAGGIADAADYCIGMDTIITTVDKKVTFEQFVKWYDYCLDAAEYKQPIPNFKSFLLGCPICEELVKLRTMRDRCFELEHELKKMCDEHPMQKD